MNWKRENFTHFEVGRLWVGAYEIWICHWLALWLRAKPGVSCVPPPPHDGDSNLSHPSCLPSVTSTALPRLCPVGSNSAGFPISPQWFMPQDATHRPQPSLSSRSENSPNQPQCLFLQRVPSRVAYTISPPHPRPDSTSPTSPLELFALSPRAESMDSASPTRPPELSALRPKVSPQAPLPRQGLPSSLFYAPRWVHRLHFPHKASWALCSVPQGEFTGPASPTRPPNLSALCPRVSPQAPPPCQQALQCLPHTLKVFRGNNQLCSWAGWTEWPTLHRTFWTAKGNRNGQMGPAAQSCQQRVFLPQDVLQWVPILTGHLWGSHRELST